MDGVGTQNEGTNLESPCQVGRLDMQVASSSSLLLLAGVKKAKRLIMLYNDTIAYMIDVSIS